ncbi:glycosyltransferase [Lysinibacillus pakistanensis]|uniref:glycosyltransferase n=1 Tax=Lysinibacillus pakistanensis TaxID=759811 RepID=UPI003D2C7A51
MESVEKKNNVSVIILTKDKVEYLKQCINTLEKYHNMDNDEIIIISNNSVEEHTFVYFNELKKKPNYRIIEYNLPFNYALLNNFGVKHATGKYLLFLNNDMEFILPNTINNLIDILNQENVGVVGATLLYPNNTIQHAGVNLHSKGAWQPYRYALLEELPHLRTNHQVSAVIGACLLIRRNDFERLQGFNKNLKVVLNDIDLCLRMNKKGFKTICAKDTIIHHEGISRGKESPPSDVSTFISIWEGLLYKGDPYDISLEISQKHLKRNFEEFLIEKERPIYVFGTGEKGKTALSLLEKWNIQGYIDNDRNKWKTKLDDYHVYSPRILEELSVKPYVVIASYYYNEIREQIEALGYKNQKDFYRLF